MEIHYNIKKFLKLENILDVSLREEHQTKRIKKTIVSKDVRDAPVSGIKKVI